MSDISDMGDACQGGRMVIDEKFDNSIFHKIIDKNSINDICFNFAQGTVNNQTIEYLQEFKNLTKLSFVQSLDSCHFKSETESKVGFPNLREIEIYENEGLDKNSVNMIKNVIKESPKIKKATIEIELIDSFSESKELSDLCIHDFEGHSIDILRYIPNSVHSLVLSEIVGSVDLKCLFLNLQHLTYLENLTITHFRSNESCDSQYQTFQKLLHTNSKLINISLFSFNEVNKIMNQELISKINMELNFRGGSFICKRL